MQVPNQHVDVGPARHVIEEAAALSGDPALHQFLGGDGVDDVLTVEYKAARRREASEDMAQRCTVAAAYVSDEPRPREIIGRGNGCMPIAGEVRHHCVEDAGFVLVLAQISETAHVPGRLV